MQAGFESVLAGGMLVLLIALLPLILFLVALWRIGTGTQQNAVATMKLAQAVQGLTPGDEEIDASLAQVANAKDLAAAVKSQAEGVADLVEQAKLAVQWYAHSLQDPAGKPKPAKK